MTVFLILMDCGDYYCEGQHTAGVYTTRPLAEAALEKALTLTRTSSPGGKAYQRYFDGQIDEMALDAEPEAGA